MSNGCHSSLYDIFRECARFDLLSSVCDMVFDNKPVVSKQQWSRLVWQQSWSIEDAYWGSVNTIMKSNDLLNTHHCLAKTMFLFSQFSIQLRDLQTLHSLGAPDEFSPVACLKVKWYNLSK